MDPTRRSDLGERLTGAVSLVSPSDPAFERLVLRRRRRQRNERILAGVVAMVVAGGVMGGTLAVLAGSRRPGHAVAGSGSAGGPGPAEVAVEPGQYLYLRTTWYLQDGRAVESTWWSPDGSGRIEGHSTASFGIPDDGTYGPGQFPVESDVSGLSSDPATLAAQLRERSGPNGASPQPDITPGPGQAPETGGLWRAVQRLLEFPNSVPDLRAALFHVGEGIPGVERVDGVLDPVGRDAVELRLTSEGMTVELFFDPASLQLMAVARHDTDGILPAYEILDEAVVGSNGATPTDGQWLFPSAVGDPPGAGG
jgi:hypothetical protein